MDDADEVGPPSAPAPLRQVPTESTGGKRKPKARRLDEPSTKVLDRVLQTTVAPKTKAPAELPKEQPPAIAPKVTPPVVSPEGELESPEPADAKSAPALTAGTVVTAPKISPLSPPAAHGAPVAQAQSPPLLEVPRVEALAPPPPPSPPVAAPTPPLALEQLPQLQPASAGPPPPPMAVLPAMPAMTQKSSEMRVAETPTEHMAATAPPANEDEEPVVFRRFRSRSMLSPAITAQPQQHATTAAPDSAPLPAAASVVVPLNANSPVPVASAAVAAPPLFAPSASASVIAPAEMPPITNSTPALASSAQTPRAAFTPPVATTNATVVHSPALAVPVFSPPPNTNLNAVGTAAPSSSFVAPLAASPVSASAAPMPATMHPTVAQQAPDLAQKQTPAQVQPQPFASPAPAVRSRRIVPPKAQPPDSSPEKLTRATSMSNPPPSEVIFKNGSAESLTPAPRARRGSPSSAALRDENLTSLEDVPSFEQELPPQIGEWPPRRPQPVESGPWRALMIVSLGAFVFTVAAWIYWQDDRVPVEDTLQLQREFQETARPSAINRMRTLLMSVAPVQSAELVNVPPWDWDTRELSRVVESNGVARENLRDLLAEGDWHPTHVAWFEEDIGSHGAWTTLTILKQAEAAYLMRRGEEEAAFTAAIDLAELSRSLQDIHAWPSYYDRSLRMFERACQSIVVLLQASKTLNQKKLQTLQEEFVKCAPSDQVLRSAMSAWYLFEKKVMMGVESREAPNTMLGGINYERPGRLFFKPNRTLELFLRSFQDLRDEAEKSPYSRSSQPGFRVNRLPSTAGLPNSGGQAWFASRIPPYLELPERQSIAHSQHAVTLTMFAIRRFAIDFKRLPERLINLRSDYLKDIPADPFSGEPLKYDANSGVVTSVGTNFTLDPGKGLEPPLSDPREIAAKAGRPQ